MAYWKYRVWAGQLFKSIALNAFRFRRHQSQGSWAAACDIFTTSRARLSGTMRDQSIGYEMNWRHDVFGISALCLAALAASPALAQTRVGEAAVVKNEVVRVAGSATTPIHVGDSVVRDEIVRTGLDSAARLVMADSTN